MVAGIAGLVTAFAYFIGAGDTAVGRTIDGFTKIVEFLDVMFGSWQGFTQGVVTLWHQLEYFWEDIWLNIKGVAIAIWEYLKAEFPNVIYGWGSKIAEFAVKVMGVMKQLGLFIKKLWNDIVDYIADKMANVMIRSQAQKDVMAKYDGKKLSKAEARGLGTDELVQRTNAARTQAETEGKDQGLTGLKLSEFVDKRMKEIFPADQAKAILDRNEQQYAGRKLSGDELQQLVDKEVSSRMASARQLREQRDNNKQVEFSDDTKAVENSTKAQVAGIEKWKTEGMAKSPLDHMRERMAAEAANEEAKKKLEEERKRAIQDDMAKLYSMPKLSDKIKAGWDGLKKASGLEGIIGALTGTGDKMKADADKAKKDAADAVKNPGNLKLNQAAVTPDKIKRQDISETFKNLSAMRLLGGKMVDPKVAAQKAQLAAQHKANDILKTVVDEVKKIAPGVAALLGWQ